MPQTLAQLVRGKHPGAYDDLDDATLERSVKAKYPGVYDDLPTSSLPTRPISAEDFAPPAPSKGWPAKLGDAAAGLFKSTIGAIPETARALSDLQRGALGGDLDAMQRTFDRGRGIIGAQGEQFRKAGEAGFTPEGVARAVTGAVPLLGPAMAQAGDKIGAGDWEGVGEGIGLAATPFLPDLLPVAGRGAAATGRAVKVGAKVVAPYAGDALSELPLAGVVRKPVERFLANRERAAEIKTAKQLVDTPEAFAKRGGEHKTVPAPTRASGEQALSGVLDELRTDAELPQSVELPPAPDLPPGYTPRTSAQSRVLGRVLDMAQDKGRLVRDASGRPVKGAGANIDTALADALEELMAAKPEAVELPPVPGLPPGYTPRTTVPKPKAPAKAPARPVAKRTPDASQGPPNYFLRKPTGTPAADVAPVERGPITEDMLPASWRGRTDQPLVSPQGATGQQWAAEFADELKARGLSAADAIDAVTRNRSLPPMVRLQMVSALKRVQ